MRSSRATQPRLCPKTLDNFACARIKAKSFVRRRPFIILGKMRKLAALRQAHGLLIDVRQWARVIAAELAEVNAANLIYRARWIGLGDLTAGLAHEIAAAERHHRDEHGHRGRQARPFSCKTLGELLDLVRVERDELKFWHATAIDETPEKGRKRRAKERAATASGKVKAREREAKKKVRDRKRKEAQRRAERRPTQGDRSRAAAERRATIQASGLSRAAYYRRKKAQSETVVSTSETVASTRGLKGNFTRSTSSDTGRDGAPGPQGQGGALSRPSRKGADLERASGGRDVRSPEAAPVTPPARPPS